MTAWSLAAALAVAASTTATPTPVPGAPPNMESYQLVLLKRGPAWTPEVTAATQELQKRHIAHLQEMAAEGHMVLAGPFSDQADPALRGACVYRVATAAEARALAERDPAVQADRLAVEVVTWWVEKGYVAFPKSPARAP